MKKNFVHLLFEIKKLQLVCPVTVLVEQNCLELKIELSKIEAENRETEIKFEL